MSLEGDHINPLKPDRVMIDVAVLPLKASNLS